MDIPEGIVERKQKQNSFQLPLSHQHLPFYTNFKQQLSLQQIYEAKVMMNLKNKQRALFLLQPRPTKNSVTN